MEIKKMKIEIEYNENDIGEVYGTIEKLKEIINSLREKMEEKE